MSDDRARKVFIGTPSFDGRVDARYANALAHTFFALIMNKFEPAIGMRVLDSTLPRARNDLIKDALQGGFDDAVMIDSDEEWDPRWVVELLNYPVDFVGAPVCKKSDEIIDFNVKATNPQIDMQTGLVEVDFIGCGLTRMSRKVMQTVWDVSRPYTNGGTDNRMMYELRIDDDGELISEDNAFCQKWKDCGGTVHVAPHMDVVHIGYKTWRRPFREVLRARMEAVHGKKAGS